jgi:hypothetical protein
LCNGYKLEKKSRAVSQLGEQTNLYKWNGTLQDRSFVPVSVEVPIRWRKRRALTNLDDAITQVLGSNFVDTAVEVNEIGQMESTLAQNVIPPDYWYVLLLWYSFYNF